MYYRFCIWFLQLAGIISLIINQSVIVMETDFVMSETGLKFCVWDRTEILHIIFMYFNVSTFEQWWCVRCCISEYHTYAGMMYQAVVQLCHCQVITFIFWKTSGTVSTTVGTVSVKWNYSSRKTFWHIQCHSHFIWHSAESWYGHQVKWHCTLLLQQDSPLF